MTTTKAERLKKYSAKMDVAGFKRLSFYAAPELELDELLTTLKTPEYLNTNALCSWSI